MRQTTAPPQSAARPQTAARPGRAFVPRLRTLLLLVLAVAGALLAGAAPVSAHAALTGSDPAQGAVVDKAPSRVSLTFSEEVALSDDSVRVLDPKGKRVDTGKTSEAGGNTYAVSLHSGLPDGTFTVTYQVVSADSHPVSGAFTFSVGAPSSTSVSASEQTAGGGVVGALYGFGRYLSYAGFIVLVGGTAFVLTCWQPGAGQRPVQRLVVAGWLALTVGTLMLLLLRGSYTGSGKLSDVFDLSPLATVLQTKMGAALVSRLLLLSAGALFIAVLFGAYARREQESRAIEGERARRTKRAEAVGAGTEDGDGVSVAAGTGTSAESGESGGSDGRAGATASETTDAVDAVDAAAEKRDLTFGLAIGGSVVAIGLAATWALAEHASTGIQTGLAMPVDVVHLLAVAVWLGGLAALLTVLFRTSAPAIEVSAVRRFSRLAFGSVAVLAATGTYQGWRQTGSWSALTDTSYGRWLLVKVGLVAVMVGAAWISRRWTGRLAETPMAVAVAEREPAAVGSVAVKASVGAAANGSSGASSDADPASEVSKGSGNADVGLGNTEVPEVAGPAEAEAAASRYAADGRASDSPDGSGAPNGSAGTASSGDSLRAAQLARQEAAVATARAKRLRDADPSRPGLRRSVLAETAVAVVVLAVTTVLTSTEPGRTEEQVKAASAASASESAPSSALTLDMSFDTGGEDGKGVVRIDLDPARVGANVMHVYVQRPNGRAFDVPEVKVAFTLESKKIGPLPVTPDRVATGHWSARGVQIPMAGDWQVEVTVRTSDIDQVTVDKNAEIG
ncbi:copper resistance protein CopC [Streptomyces cavernae]|uniref:copper resistance protein CopC n=1 Tax=Streptomyces cavernae TaxID=2259034 RepID=UPI000FEBCE81|nr:copper resistance protein CopC [Streptomyces cavernae]